jgi:hypothetical protein
MSDPRWHDADPPSRRPPYGDGAPDRRPGMRRPSGKAPRPDAPRTRDTDPRTRDKWVGDGDPRANTRRMQVPPEPRGRREPRAAGPPPNGGTMRGRDPRRRGALGRWGTLSGGLGIGIVAGSAALGALITIVLRREPGALLGVFLILGTLIGGLAVRTASARLIIPAPTLCYVVAASVAGAINDRASDTSRIGLLLHSGTWIASGFYAMTIATVLAIVVSGVRLYLDYRTRPRRPGRPGRPNGSRRPGQRRDANGLWRSRPGEDLDGTTRPVSPPSPAGPVSPPSPTGPRRPPLGSGPYAAPSGPSPQGPSPQGPSPQGPSPYSPPRGTRQYRPPQGDRYNFSGGA